MAYKIVAQKDDTTVRGERDSLLIRGYPTHNPVSDTKLKKFRETPVRLPKMLFRRNETGWRLAQIGRFVKRVRPPIKLPFCQS